MSEQFILTMKHLMALVLFSFSFICFTHAQFDRDRFEIGIKYKEVIGSLTSNTFTQTNPWAAELQFSYHLPIANKSSIGIGIGLTGFHEPSYNTLPIDLKFTQVVLKNYSPLELNIGAGYALPAGETFESGYRTNAGLSWFPKLFGNHNIGVSFGYALQQFRDIDLGYKDVLGNSVVGNRIANMIYAGATYRIN